MFEVRIKEGKPIYLHEFLYPLMQGYDSIAMDVDGEIGGNDQVFNMLVGRDLMGSVLRKDKFVMAMKLLQDPSGRKMGKSEGNMIPFTDSPQEMFGKIMSWSDNMIAPGFELLTDMSKEELSHLPALLRTGNPRDLKLTLATTIVAPLFGKDEAEGAREKFLRTFSRGEIPHDIQTFTFKKSSSLRDAVMVMTGASGSSAARLIKQGGVTELPQGKKLTNPKMPLEKPMEIRIGKKDFWSIHPEE